MPASDADVRVEKWKLWSIIITVIAGPVLAFVFAKSGADTNHAQSAKGYELLATMANQHEQRLDNIEKTLLRIETQVKVAPATQVSLTGPIIVPGARVDPWPHVVAKAPMKVPTKAPVVAKVPLKTEKAVVVVNPKHMASPASAPVLKAAPAKAPRLHAPARLRDFKR